MAHNAVVCCSIQAVTLCGSRRFYIKCQVEYQGAGNICLVVAPTSDILVLVFLAGQRTYSGPVVYPV